MPMYNAQNPIQNYQYPPQPAAPPPPPPKPSQSSIKGSFKSKLPLQPQRQAPPLPESANFNYHQHLVSTTLQAGRDPSYMHSQAHDSSSQAQKPRGRLNLRNPLSLLARRRSSQALNANHAPAQSRPAVPLGNDFDPSIRGKKIHDFSVPRLGRPHTSGGPSTSSDARAGENYLFNSQLPNASISTTALDANVHHQAEKDHAPVFKEQFDDAGLEGDRPSMRKSEAFMNSISMQESQPGPDPSALPAFARSLPSNVAGNLADDRKASPPPTRAQLEPVPESPSLQPSPATSPPNSHSRASSLNDQSLQGLGSPKRFKSTSSRFSFDLAGVGSAVQEKLLEDKHRQKAIQEQRLNAEKAFAQADDEDDEPDFDDMMDDPGYEERIPGINADEDVLEGQSIPVSQQTLDSLPSVTPNKSSFDSAISPGSTGLTSPGTPRDMGGHPIGFALSKISQDIDGHQAVRKQSDNNNNNNNEHKLRPRSTPGNESKSKITTQGLQRIVSSDSNLAGLPKRQTYHDDDLYFDDGMIEDVNDEASSQDFDESVFDDNSYGLYGLPLRDRTLKPLENLADTMKDPLTLEKDGVGESEPIAPQRLDSTASSHPSTKSESLSAELRDAVPDLNFSNRHPIAETTGLTHDNLAAYNGRDLALGVLQASNNGAFDRAESASSYSEHEAAARTSAERNRSSGLVFDLSGFDGEGDNGTGEDDDIVAAANAEALENDDDGFYGQEFGFYAQASSSAEGQYFNGGYFGHAPEGVHRSHSGRNDFQEPSLTPITERSEWSNRNSFALHGHPLSGSSYPSELQLSNLMNMPEDSMTLEALMKLRRSAWGGSNASLHSSSNSQNSGSPLTFIPPGAMFSPSLPQQSPANPTHAKGATLYANAGGSLNSFNDSSGHLTNSSHDSDDSPSVDSPTITLSSPHFMNSVSAPLPVKQPFSPPSMAPPPPPQPSMPPPPVPIRTAAPSSSSSLATSLPTQATFSSLSSASSQPRPIVGPQGQRRSWAAGHKRRSSGGGSGTESVSYKEEGGKWVLEKRRTGDGGVEEILGRSVIEGGRI